MKKTRKNSRAAALLSSMLLFSTMFSCTASANVLDDIKNGISGAWNQVTSAVGSTPVGEVLQNGYQTVVDFIFTYETQPDDEQMEGLARSWAITSYLAEEDRSKPLTYYFDNHTYRMVKDPTQIGRGYNLKKTPNGSNLQARHSGILRAVVADATSYTVDWVNYDDAVNEYLLKKVAEKNGTETEAAQTAQTE